MADGSRPGLTRRRDAALAAVLALAVVGAFVAVLAAKPRSSTLPPPVARCDRAAATRGALAREFNAATSGQTICLAAGDYGTFRGGRKPGTVTLRPRPGARVAMLLALDSTVNLRVEGMIVKGAEITGATRNLTIANSHFTGQVVVHADDLVNAHVLLDRNTYVDIDTCSTCFAGRVHVTGNSGRPSGVIVAHSLFRGGSADGVRADADGVVVTGNEFTGLAGHGDSHTDPIQIYGGTHVVIRGNFFHDNAVAAQIMMANGGDHNVVEDNVIAPGGYTWAMTWNADNGSVIRHNTFADGACEAGVRCGIISLAGRPAGAARPTVIRDNVLTAVGSDGEGAGFVADHNLTAERVPSAGDVMGTPVYVGPHTTYGGYRLAPGSPGQGDASDAGDTGIR